jgi:hypothetical protein
MHSGKEKICVQGDQVGKIFYFFEEDEKDS